jgi:hypothetical protein
MKAITLSNEDGPRHAEKHDDILAEYATDASCSVGQVLALSKLGF